MKTISGKRLGEALKKAKDVGVVTDDFTIFGCDITLRNLRPEEYTACIDDAEGLDDAKFMFAYEKAHLCRSLTVLNGVSLDFDFVEVEEEDPKTKTVRTVKMERHAYIRREIVDTWSKEMVTLAFRKYGDVETLAEKQGKEGVTFLTPDETDEDQFRRLLGELKEVEAKLPPALIEKTLDEFGLMTKTAAEEAKEVMERADALAREQIQREKEAEAAAKKPAPQAPPVVTAPPAPPYEEPPAPVLPAPLPQTLPAPSPGPQPRPAIPQPQALTPEQVMAMRQPMNRQAGSLPVDPHQVLRDKAAQMPVPVAAPIDPPVARPGSRSASIAALHAEAAEGLVSDDMLPGESTAHPTHLTGPGGVSIPVYAPPTTEATELRPNNNRTVDVKSLHGALDRPPVAGVNSKFRPPVRR